MPEPAEPNDRLVALAIAVADGGHIDWSEAERLADSDAERQFLNDLRAIADVSRLNTPGAGTASLLHESILSRVPEDAMSGGQPGVQWGPLRIIEKVGRGSFGDVYRAWDARLDREVALKLLRRRDADSQDAEAVEEGRLMARVRHPNVATVYGAERIDGRTGVWMEFVRGRTLRDEVRRRGRLSLRELLTVGIELSRALAAVHTAGLLHRDIKAQNVMRDDAGRLVLMDFGTGREALEANGGPGELAGTPLYVAPEVFAGRPATVQSDVYSLGVLLWYLATGSFPVSGTSVAEIREAHARGVRLSLRVAHPDVPRAFARVIERATSIDPAPRHRAASELETDLLRLASAPVRRRRAAVAAGLAIAVLAGVAFADRTWRATPSAQQRLAFQPRDYVLITRFDNRTGDNVFDGAIEYALERELLQSNVVGLVPVQRVHDALTMMRRPLESVIDREIGREIALRDGGVKALLSGRVETAGTGYVLTAQLINPVDGAVVASDVERAASRAQVTGAVSRHASRFRMVLGERLAQLPPGSVTVEPASTRSLKAFQLYNQAYRLGREGQWEGALALAREAVREDPEFGSGWMWVAWALERTRRLPREEAQDRDIRAAAERARGLIDGAPEWERLWIVASYHVLHRQWAESVPANRALLALRPDHFYAANNLYLALLMTGRRGESSDLFAKIADSRPLDPRTNVRAAAAILGAKRDPVPAKPYVDRVRTLITDSGGRLDTSEDALWIAMFDAYVDWRNRDIQSAARRIDATVARLEHEHEPIRNQLAFYAGNFYAALGQLSRADRLLGMRSDAFADLHRLGVVAERGDTRALAERIRFLEKTNPRFVASEGRRPMRYLRAGLVADARRIVATFKATPAANPTDAVLVDVGRGHLALLDGRTTEAIIILTKAVENLQSQSNIGDYHHACRGLATALVRETRRPDAIGRLERCAAEVPILIETGFFGTAPWMETRLQLADEYRAVGRIDDARAIEQDLRTLLAVADEDHAIKRQLLARGASRAVPFEARDWVLVAAFDNRTGDPALDGAVEHALAHELSNSRFINVVPRLRINDALQLMEKPVTAQVDESLAREVALRDGGIRVIVAGRLARVGSHYNLSARIVRPSDGVVLGSLSETARDQSVLLPAIQRLALNARDALGEQMPAAERSAALQRVTTPSLRALQLYSEALEGWSEERPRPHAAKTQLLREALSLDPNFAMARVHLASLRAGVTPEDAIATLETVSADSARLSQAERLFVTARLEALKWQYAGGPDARQHLERAIAAFEALARLRPDDYQILHTLAGLYRQAARPGDARALHRRMATARPTSVLSNQQVAVDLLETGDVEAAREQVSRIRALGAPLEQMPIGVAAWLALFDAHYAWLRNNPREALAVTDRVAEQSRQLPPDVRNLFETHVTFMYLTLGCLDRAEQFASTSSTMGAIGPEWRLASVVAQRDDVPALRHFLNNRLRDPRIASLVVSYFLDAGLVERARELMGQSPPPLYRSQLALAEGRIEEAVRLLEEERRRSAAARAVTNPRTARKLAEALTAAGRRSEAIEVLEEASRARSRSAANASSGFDWLRVRAELSKLYRDSAHHQEADAIDAELRVLLAVADADHPLLLRLKARQ